MEVHILVKNMAGNIQLSGDRNPQNIKKTGLEQDIFIFHTVFPMLGDGVKLARTDKDDVAGFYNSGLGINRNDAAAFFITMISTSLCQ